MDIQSSTLNDLFVLFPVIIPGWVSPVKPVEIADGGVPQSLYDGQPEGLECLIDPWTELQALAWTLAVDDRADLYVNDDPTAVAGKTVAPGDEQLRMRLYVPHGRLIHGVNRLHYKVTRPGGNSETSRDLNVLYHLRAPGEPAPQGLELVIPAEIISGGVGAKEAATGVTFSFSYTNRRAYDSIHFLLSDVTVKWEVTDAPAPVQTTLFTETFQQAGDNPNTLIQYRVFDQLGNFNQSTIELLDIHLERVTVPEITLVKDSSGVEIPEGGSTGDTSVTLNGNAMAEQLIELFDGTDPKGIFRAVGGFWASVLIPVEVGQHIFTAKTIEGTQVSQPWRLSVVGLMKPVITDIKDSGDVSIPPDGETDDLTGVTMIGEAGKGQIVRIYINDIPHGDPVMADATTGIWFFAFSTLTINTQYIVRAQALYADNPSSDFRRFTTRAACLISTDFEDGSLNGWKTSFMGYDFPMIEGSRRLRLHTTFAGAAALLRREIHGGVTAGKNYEFTVWAKKGDSKSYVLSLAVGYGAEWDTEVKFNLSSTWQQMKITGVVKPLVQKIVLAINYHNVIGTTAEIYLDDVVFCER